MAINIPKSAAELALEAARASNVAEVLGDRLPSAMEAIRKQTAVLDAFRANTSVLDTIAANISPSAIDLALETVRRNAPLLEQAQSLHDTLLSHEGLAALDTLRDTVETLQGPLKLSDLKKRAVTTRSLPADATTSRVVNEQGSFAKSTSVRAAEPADSIAPEGEGARSNEPAAVASAADIGRVIREARERRGLSQQKLADLANVGRRFLSELENGKPSLAFEKVIAVASALDVDLFARARR